MSLVDNVKQDHEFFRAKLSLLEAVIEHKAPFYPTVRDLCKILSQHLRHHMQREGWLAVLCSRKLERYDSSVLARFAIQHEVDQGVLRVLRRYVAREPGCSFEEVQLAIRTFVRGLQRHMEEQEMETFPFFEEVLGMGHALELSNIEGPSNCAVGM